MIVVRLLIIWVLVGVVVVAGISATHPTLQFNGPLRCTPYSRAT